MAHQTFTQIAHSIAVTVVNSKAELNELRELLSICREYIIGIRLQRQQKEESANPVRACELGAYFTHCNMQPHHSKLAIKSAMAMSFKLKNFNTAGSFARRLLELNPQPEIATQARKVLRVCDQTPSDAQELNYNERNPFVVCNKTLSPIYKGSPLERCGFCGASYKPQFKKERCEVCSVGVVGAETSGLQAISQSIGGRAGGDFD